MILYVKRLNSHVGSAETFNIPAVNTEDIPCGCICNISSQGYLTKNVSSTGPKYLTLESKSITDGKKHISCLRLAPEMVLKGEITADEASYKFGAGCSFSSVVEGELTYLGTGGTDGEIIAVEDGWVTMIVR